MRLAIVLLVACGSREAADQTGSARDLTADCNRVAAHLEKLDTTTSGARAITHPAIKKTLDDSQAKRRKWVVERCIADSWPQAMITCVTAATSFAETESCTPWLDATLSRDQITALNQGYQEIETTTYAELLRIAEHELEDMVAMRDRLCACADAACRKAAAGELPKAPDDPVIRKVYDKLGTEIAACLNR